MPKGKSEGLEGRVISLLLLALLVGAGVWIYKSSKATKRAQAQTEVARAGATAAREKASTLETENSALLLARKKAEDIAKAFDAAPRLFTDPETSEKTKILKPGETFTADKPTVMLHPDRLAEATGALENYAKQKKLLAECGTDRDGFKEEATHQKFRALKWKARFPIGVLIGAGTVGTLWMISAKPWK